MMLSDVCLTSDVCLSVAYIWPKLRTERPRQTKIGAEVAHVTRDSDTTSKVKRSKVKVTRPLCSPPRWRVRRLQRWAWERVGRGKLLLRCRLLGGARRFGAHGAEERGGAYRGGRPPTACLSLYCRSVPARCRPGTKRLMNEWMKTRRRPRGIIIIIIIIQGRYL